MFDAVKRLKKNFNQQRDLSHNMKYIWRNKSWPDFTWDSDLLLKPLGDVRFNQGSLIARIRDLGFDIQQTARADVLVEETLKTSAIEGETLDPNAVRSSEAG